MCLQGEVYKNYSYQVYDPITYRYGLNHYSMFLYVMSAHQWIIMDQYLTKKINRSTNLFRICNDILWAHITQDWTLSYIIYLFINTFIYICVFKYIS